VLSDVVIVNHNSGPLLAQAAASAVAEAGAEHVWVVDTGSTDGSVEALRAQGRVRGQNHGEARSHGVHVLSVPNDGFAAASNRGIAATGSPFVLLLNPDAVLRPGALELLEATADANPRAGVVGALVLNHDASIQADSFGRFPSLAGATGLRLWRFAQRLFGNAGLSPKAPASTTATDWVTGAAMLVRREAINDVGPMDEGFFLYYEDVDWCRRMRARDWEVLLEPTAQVVHHRGGSDVSGEAVARAYRESFYRYCDLHGLWGLKAVARLGLTLRRLFGGAP
jgi:N-acetylglucosaminyl-diphospho-decaprenol L-rhamnosyltransferase